jgi:hypothetical protein
VSRCFSFFCSGSVPGLYTCSARGFCASVSVIFVYRYVLDRESCHQKKFKFSPIKNVLKCGGTGTGIVAFYSNKPPIVTPEENFWCRSSVADPEFFLLDPDSKILFIPDPNIFHAGSHIKRGMKSKNYRVSGRSL